MKSKLNKFVDDIAENPSKGLIWAILIILAIVALYYGWKKIKEIYSDISDSVNSRLDNPVNSNNLTYNGAWYKNAADTLFAAMSGAGTDEDTIFGVIQQLVTQDDWNELVRKYGTRTLSRFLQGDLSGTLQTHLRDDLSSSDIKELKNMIPDINTGL